MTFTAKCHTSRKRRRKRFYSVVEKKKTWTQYLNAKEIFQASMNNQNPNTVRVRNLGA